MHLDGACVGTGAWRLSEITRVVSEKDWCAELRTRVVSLSGHRTLRAAPGEAHAKQLSEQRAALRLQLWRQQKLRSSGVPLGHHGTASSSLPVGLKQNLVHTALFRGEHRSGVTCPAVAFESGRGNKVTTRRDINRERRIFTFQFFMCSADHQPRVARSGCKGINPRATTRPSNSVSHLGNVSRGWWYINCASSHGSDEDKADRI